MQAFKPAYLLKRDSNRGVFLWSFWEYLFWSTSSNDCFCISEIQTTNNVIYILPENFIFNFRIYKIFYQLSFLNFSSTEFVLAFTFFSHRISNISHNISDISLPSSLNRLNTFGHYQKFVLISNVQSLSSGFILR